MIFLMIIIIILIKYIIFSIKFVILFKNQFSLENDSAKLYIKTIFLIFNILYQIYFW
jgi:hypothetical protein